MSVQFTLIGNDDGDSNIVVFVPGAAPQVAHSTHPNFAKIVALALANDESIVALFDVAATVGQKFERLSERVTTKNGRLYLDGEEIANALTEQVLRFLDEGVNDWLPLVRFFENVQSNPNEHSREQLYAWLAAGAFTITVDGMIVGYKGVRPTGEGYESINRGRAIVDGVEVSGAIPNNLGSVIEMPRGEVQHDPSVGCHTGLHVGTYEYANGFAQGALLEVHVHPRDVVSVPTDCSAQKMRTCRYVVIDIIDQPYTTAVKPYDYEDDGDLWGDGEGAWDDACDYCNY
jgi:hypothetical protein